MHSMDSVQTVDTPCARPKKHWLCEAKNAKGEFEIFRLNIPRPKKGRPKAVLIEGTPTPNVVKTPAQFGGLTIIEGLTITGPKNRRQKNNKRPHKGQKITHQPASTQPTIRQQQIPCPCDIAIYCTKHKFLKPLSDYETLEAMFRVFETPAPPTKPSADG